MKPLVTLVTPVFNAMPWFREYLDCVLRQTWRPLELIIVDDGSDDGSWEYLTERLPDFRRAGIMARSLRIPHAGQAAAVNAALPLASGEYLTWCDADDLLTPDSIEKKADFLMCFPGLGLVRSDGIILDGDTGQRLSHSAKAEDRSAQNIFDALFRGTTYCYAGCYMVRTALLFACYPDRQIPLSPEGQNLQLLLPPASRSDCGFLPDALHIYCRRSGGHSSKKLSFRQACARLEHFSALRRAVLPHCLCDAKYYLEEDRRLTDEARRSLCRAAAAQARKDAKK